MGNIKTGSSRRKFIAATGILIAGSVLNSRMGLGRPEPDVDDRVIDIHQHLRPGRRTDQQMVDHQKTMGATTTILLPLIRVRPVPDKAGANEECYEFAKLHPKSFLFGACGNPESPNALLEIERYLKLGAVVIGELKFAVACDAPGMQRIYSLAADYDVPVLMHWQYRMFNFGFERFYKILNKYQKTKFIGHGPTWWANISGGEIDQSVAYPKGKVIPGGLTEKYLSDYSNMYGGMASNSGLNGLIRDKDHGEYFLRKFQDKLLFGSDCEDASGRASEGCTGAKIIEGIRNISPNRDVERKILYENARQMFGI